MRILAVLLNAVILSALSACSIPVSPSQTNTVVPSLSPTSPPAGIPQQTTPTSTPLAPVEHDIAVRVVDGIGEFFNRQTGQKFIPRGMNYVRLAPQTKSDRSPTFGHSLFDPGQFDSTRVLNDLEKMHADGYNVIPRISQPGYTQHP